MKIALICPSPPDLYAPGVRTLSAYLKKNHHQARLILLAGGTERLRFGGRFVYSYQRHIIDQVIELTRDVDLIGLSFMTQYFDRALQLTKELKQASRKPVVWGGIHPTLCPEEGIAYADMVCVGEGEEALLELMNRMEQGTDYFSTRNFWFRKNGQVVRNEVRPLVEDLDTLPFQDYEFGDQYVYDPLKDSIVPLTEKMFEALFSLAPDLDGRLKPCYNIMTSRGCPMNCAFCASSVLKNKLYSHKYVRYRSVENVMQELEQIKARFPSIRIIQFFDDILFSQSKEYIEQLSLEYKRRIGLPFYAQASVTTLTDEKLEYLLDAGLIWVEIGIQSGSDRINAIYRRTVSNSKVLEAANKLNCHKHKMLSPCYHVILDNPWETNEDVLSTLDLILSLPRPYWIKLSSLCLFPKTGVYEKAKQEGLLTNDLEQVYRKPFVYVAGSYLNYLVYLAGFCYFPRSFFRILASSRLVRLFQRDSSNLYFARLYKLTEVVRKGGRAVRALLRGDFGRLAQRIEFLMRARTNW